MHGTEPWPADICRCILWTWFLQNTPISVPMTEEYVRPTPEKHLPAFIVQSDGTCLPNGCRNWFISLTGVWSARLMTHAFRKLCTPHWFYIFNRLSTYQVKIRLRWRHRIFSDFKNHILPDSMPESTERQTVRMLKMKSSKILPMLVISAVTATVLAFLAFPAVYDWYISYTDSRDTTEGLENYFLSQTYRAEGSDYRFTHILNNFL